ncbi:MAG: hypothetical protein ABH826_01670 [Patescibacteria group bacterium]|nr:hypothetical protein [Patescibacteria group bacterium]
MNEEQLLRLIRLAKKTGDTLIITDPSGEGAVAVMDVDRYEALIEDGLSGFEDDILPENLFSDEEPLLEIFEEEETSIPDLPASVENQPITEVDSELEEEERFYLEPIE